jgi:large subunit ribosomal protein L21
MSEQLVPATEAEIAALAYQYYLEEGRPNGRHEIHWQRAFIALAKPAPVAKAAKTAAATDVSLIDGVGPKLTKALHEAGYLTLTQIAALNAADVAALDVKLNLKGRAAREDWVKQAKELVAGAAPRAKIDQVKAASKSR